LGFMKKMETKFIHLNELTEIDFADSTKKASFKKIDPYLGQKTIQQS
jgi:hypothetical protein